MSKTKTMLTQDNNTIKFKKAFLAELNVIFDFYNLSSKDVAQIMNVSRTQIDKYLIGSNNLSIFLLKKLLEHFNLTLSMFFEKVERRLSNERK